MKKMLKAIIEQLSQSAMANKEKGIFSSQPQINPKGGTSSFSAPNTF